MSLFAALASGVWHTHSKEPSVPLEEPSERQRSSQRVQWLCQPRHSVVLLWPLDSAVMCFRAWGKMAPHHSWAGLAKGWPWAQNCFHCYLSRSRVHPNFQTVYYQGNVSKVWWALSVINLSIQGPQMRDVLVEWCIWSERKIYMSCTTSFFKIFQPENPLSKAWDSLFFFFSKHSLHLNQMDNPIATAENKLSDESEQQLGKWRHLKWQTTKIF